MTDPISAQNAPYKIQVEGGRSYFWCACGRSQKQPLCDGSHSGTGLSPIKYTAENTKDVWFCGCKASAKKPMCDGTHKSL